MHEYEFYSNYLLKYRDIIFKRAHFWTNDFLRRFPFTNSLSHSAFRKRFTGIFRTVLRLILTIFHRAQQNKKITLHLVKLTNNVAIRRRLLNNTTYLLIYLRNTLLNILIWNWHRLIVNLMWFLPYGLACRTHYSCLTQMRFRSGCAT